MTQAQKPTSLFDPNTFTEGLQKLDRVEGIVVGSLFKHTNWAKKDGSIPTWTDGKGVTKPVTPSTVWELLVKVDDIDDPIQTRMSGSSYLMPSKDNVIVAKDKEGPFLVDPEGKREATLNTGTASAFFVTSLANAGFDFAAFQMAGTEAIIGYRIAFQELERKDEKTGKVIGKASPVAMKIIHGPGAVKGAKKTTRRTTAAVAAPAPAEGGEEFDPDNVAVETIQEVLAESSPLPKAKVSVEVNKRLQAQDPKLSNEERLKVLKATTNDELLESGPWSYDGKSLTAL